MRGRGTLILVFFIVLLPGIALVLELRYAPSIVHTTLNTIASRLFPGGGSQAFAYSIVVYGAFVYVIIFASVIVYLTLSEVVSKLAMSE